MSDESTFVRNIRYVVVREGFTVTERHTKIDIGDARMVKTAESSRPNPFRQATKSQTELIIARLLRPPTPRPKKP